MTDYCQGYKEETGGSNYRLAHQLRVAETAHRICLSKELKEVDEKIAIISGLFHDIGRIAILKSNNSKTLLYNESELKQQEIHEDIGLEVIKNLLKNQLSTNELILVCEATKKVDNHLDRSDNNKVLYDSDTLDELGSLNLFRMFTYSGVVDRTLEDTIKYWFEIEKGKKLSKITLFFTEFAKKEAKRRMKVQDKIMQELKNSGYPKP